MFTLIYLPKICIYQIYGRFRKAIFYINMEFLVIFICVYVSFAVVFLVFFIFVFLLFILIGVVEFLFQEN